MVQSRGHEQVIEICPLSTILQVLMMSVSRRYIKNEFLIHRRCNMMNSGDMPALLGRTQAHTCREWAEYRNSLSLGVLG